MYLITKLYKFWKLKLVFILTYKSFTNIFRNIFLPGKQRTDHKRKKQIPAVFLSSLLFICILITTALNILKQVWYRKVLFSFSTYNISSCICKFYVLQLKKITRCYSISDWTMMNPLTRRPTLQVQIISQRDGRFSLSLSPEMGPFDL